MRSRWWVYVSRVILAMECRSRCKGRRGRPLSTATRSSRPSILVQWKLDFEHLAEVEFALGPGQPISPHVHPASNCRVRLFSTLVIGIRVCAGQRGLWKLLPFTGYVPGNRLFQGNKRF